MNKLTIKRARLNGTYDRIYADEVNRRIRRRYSQGDELAILRQRDEKPEEFAAYHDYAEMCKAEAKAYLAKVEGVR